MGKTKSICKWDKSDYKDQFEELSKLVKEPTHVCLKCGRASNNKKAICKAEKLD